ncbi:MAG: hypothetical protein MJA83_00355, partial [Gammaproteobacteria bacterium]|nr:hypothetical protein [Gammaproteobacteria bacterium]
MSEVVIAFYCFVGLFLLGILLRTGIAFAYGARGPKHNDLRYSLSILSSWILILVSISPMIMGSMLTIVGIISLAIFVETVLTRRRAMRNINCTMLSLSVGEGKLLDPSVVRVGAEDRGIVGRATRRLIRLLETGMPFSQAVARNPQALPREALAFAVMGETINAEQAALQELAKPADLGLDSLWRSCIDLTLYLGLVLLAMIPIGSFMTIKIIPEFRKIFDDFSMDLPPMTELAVAFSNLFSGTLGVIIILGFLVLVLCILGTLLL